MTIPVGNKVIATMAELQAQQNLRHVWELLLIDLFSDYHISANSFRGNYSFLNLTLCTVTFGDST